MYENTLFALILGRKSPLYMTFVNLCFPLNISLVQNNIVFYLRINDIHEKMVFNYIFKKIGLH